MKYLQLQSVFWSAVVMVGLSGCATNGSRSNYSEMQRAFQQGYNSTVRPQSEQKKSVTCYNYGTIVKCEEDKH